MTDKELIQALRYCGDRDCFDCRWWDKVECFGEITYRNCADRLEALLDEDEHLREVTKMVPRWVSVDEQLPKEDGRYLCSVMSLVHNGRNYVDILSYDKGGFRDGHIYTDLVTHWMPLPSTEGVE